MSKVFVYTQLNIKAVLFSTIQFSVSNFNVKNSSILTIQLHLKKVEKVRSLNVKSVLFQPIQFNKSTLFRSIWLINRALSGATTLSHSGLGSNGNEGVLCILQSPSITETSPPDFLVSYTGLWWWGSYPSAEMQSLYSSLPADWKEYLPIIESSQQRHLNLRRYNIQSQNHPVRLVFTYQ